MILLVLGILLAGTGVLALGYGLSINETNLGNALIIAGTTTFNGGLLLIGLAAAVVQLNQIARALRPRADARPPGPGETAEAAGQAVALPREPAVPSMRSPVPPLRTEERIPAAGDAPPVSLSAIERLRSRFVRGDRKAARGSPAEALPLPPAVEPPASPGHTAGMLTNGATSSPASGLEAAAAPRKARDFPFRAKPRETPSASVDAVWPMPGAPRADEHSSETAEPARPPARSWPPEPSQSAVEDSQPPAIVKSGMVDGMAYTLYADGSIEAQLPQGTIRFGSIAELRAHIENNS